MTLAFVLTRLSGDLAISIAGPNATQADVEAVRKAYGLDRPLVTQFFDWVGSALTGDLGDSYFFKTRVSVADRRAHADHPDPGPDRPGDRAGGLAAARHPGGGAREHRVRSRRPDGGPARPGHAVLLAGADADDHARPAARLAADLGHRLVAALRHAGHRARLLGHPGPHPADPRRHDPGHGRRTISARRGPRACRAPRSC